jgi:hypothetical protein
MKRLYAVGITGLSMLLPPLLAGPGSAVCAEEQRPQGSETSNVSPGKDLGTYRLQRPDGGQDRIHYSIVTPEEEAKTKEEEKEKLDKSLEVLKNIMIDRRR